MSEKTYQAKPDEVLEKKFMDPSSTISVHESTWWARDEIKSLRKRLEAVEAVHGGLEATLPALSPVEQAIIKAYGKALKGEQCHIWLVYD